VLEAGGEPVGFVPGVAEHVGEEALDDAVPADRGDRGPAPDRRQFDAAVRLVVDEPAIGEALDGRGDRARCQPEPLRERARVRTTVARQPVDGFQRFAIRF